MGRIAAAAAPRGTGAARWRTHGSMDTRGKCTELPTRLGGRAWPLTPDGRVIWSLILGVLGARLQGPRLRFGGGQGVRSHLRIRFEGGSRQIGFIDTFLPPVCRRGSYV